MGCTKYKNDRFRKKEKMGIKKIFILIASTVYFLNKMTLSFELKNIYYLVM